MNSKRVFFVMVGLLSVVGILLVATVVAGDKLLRKQSDKLASLKLEDQVIEMQQASLVQANKDLQKYAELKSIAKQIVPQDKDQARAVREIVSLAEQSGIRIASLTFPSSTLGQPVPKAPATEGAEAPKNTAPPVTQVKPVDGIKGLYYLDIAITSDSNRPVTYNKLVEFLERLENNRRTAQVSQISIQPDPRNRTGLNFTLTVTVYIKP